MTVIVANDIPPAVRGLLKRWFIEPRPNVFVGTVNPRTREKVLEYVRRHAPDVGMLVIATEKNSQGFVIDSCGEPGRHMVYRSGLQLIAEKWGDAPSPSVVSGNERPASGSGGEAGSHPRNPPDADPGSSGPAL